MTNLVKDVENFKLQTPNVEEYYNPNVFRFNGVDDTLERRTAVLDAHIERHKCFDEALSLDPQCNKTELRSLADKLKNIEYDLQHAWGFDLDSSYHSYWFKMPHCTCPKLDNIENLGTGRKIILKNCPIHS